MDTRTGRIFSDEEMEKFRAAMLSKGEWETHRRHLVEMATPPTDRQMARQPPKVGRNEPCPCGSGKKFKKCCLHPAP